MKNKFGIKRFSKIPRILIVGGVAGGASCAARARRLSEEAEIIIFERGPYVSFANCGLPYYVGNVITSEKSLLIATPEFFRKRFNIEVRVRNEVREIDTEKRELEIKNSLTGELYRESYDALVLATGSSPIRPPITGIKLPGIFTLRTIPDSQQIRKWITVKKVSLAIVVGGGFIGLEAAENLAKRGISVTIVEILPQILPPIDPEMAVPVHEHLVNHGISIRLGDGVARFNHGPKKNSISLTTKSGENYTCDMVLLATGVQPEVSLARKAGLEIGQMGGIRVTNQMRTSDEWIWAVGDVVEVRDFVTGEWTLNPLAGPANRQGRIAADVILGRNSVFRGVQDSMICKVFNITVAATGVSEKTLLRRKLDGQDIEYEKIYLHTSDHADYYPGAKPITAKLIFSTKDGRILGAQAVGEDGVEKFIDVISMAIQRNSTTFDLEESELCYAPQFGAAKDPVNIAGMIASNSLRGDSPIAHWGENIESQYYFLDVREPDEYKAGHFDSAKNIPLHTLRNRLEKLPRDKEILVYCGVGHRSYYASRILRLNGFLARSISGGMETLRAKKWLPEV